MGANLVRGIQSIKAKTNHPKFKNAIIYQDDSSSKLRTNLSIDNLTYKQWKLKLQKFFALKCKADYLFLPINSEYKSSKLCSSSGQAQLTFLNYPHLLKEEIQERKGKKSRFSEPQLWYLLYSLVSAKFQFINNQVNDRNLGDISPQNIFISQTGQIKIGTIFSWPGQQTNFQKCLHNSQNQMFFLSPQDMFHLQLGSLNNKSNIFSQLFSIGMVALSAGITDHLTDIYDMKNKKFNFFDFNKKLMLWRQQKYSQILIATILSLCEIQPIHRVKIQQLYQMLNSNQNSIKTKMIFTILTPPSIIQEIIKNNRQKKKKKYEQNSSINLTENQNIKIGNNDEVNSPLKKKNYNLNLGKGLRQGNIGSSIRLTHAILDPPSPFTPGKQEVPSLFSSTDILMLKKVESTNLPQKSLKRYQQINANQKIRKSNQSQYSNDFNEGIKTSNSYIVQNPIVFDKNRPSDDIQEEITPTSTPLQVTMKNQQFQNDIIFQQPLGLSDQSISANVIKNKNLVIQQITVNSPKKKIRQAKSFDPEKDEAIQQTTMLHSHKVNQQSKKQSTESNKQSSSSQFLSLQKQSKEDNSNQHQTIKITEQIDLSQVQIQNQKSPQQKNSIKKKVQFHSQEGNSEYLQIQDIDFEHIKGSKIGDQSLDNILIHYKQKDKEEEVIEKIIIHKNKNQASS